MGGASKETANSTLDRRTTVSTCFLFPYPPLAPSFYQKFPAFGARQGAPAGQTGGAAGPQRQDRILRPGIIRVSDASQHHSGKHEEGYRGQDWRGGTVGCS